MGQPLIILFYSPLFDLGASLSRAYFNRISLQVCIYPELNRNASMCLRHDGRFLKKSTFHRPQDMETCGNEGLDPPTPIPTPRPRSSGGEFGVGA